MKSSNILHSRSVTRAEYALFHRSYRAASRDALNNDNAVAHCIQLHSELRRRLNSWYTGLGDQPVSRFHKFFSGGETISLKGENYVRFGASRTLTNFLAR